MTDGILLLDKPINMTSNDALQKVKRLFAAKKAGHTGSLDPIATGQLPLCFGKATKLSEFLGLESDKSYHVVAKLGEKTTTGDIEGAIVQTRPVGEVTANGLKKILAEFLGTIQQIPPMYSAIKYQGKPLYVLARQGIEVPRQARPVQIYALTLQNLSEDTFTFEVHCSKGTYVRTLVEDIGEKLGCGAHVRELRRTMVSPFQGLPMVTLEQLKAIQQQAGRSGLLAHLLPIETALAHFPAIKLPTASAFYLRMGQAVRVACPLSHSFVRLLSEDGKFLGIGEPLPDGRIKPRRLM